MKVYTNTNTGPLTQPLAQLLENYRTERGFDAGSYVTEKAKMIATYAQTSGLKAAVVGISGGIDSSVVLGLLNYAYTHFDGPRPVGVMLPAHSWDGASRQEETVNLGKILCNQLQVQNIEININNALEALAAQFEQTTLGQTTPWARGQLTATMRTPSLYYTTSILSENAEPAFVVGTTNLDEGSWLGYVGKASDGMVDLQPICDLHKSEVYKVAEHLQLDERLLAPTPTGDMYDGRVDEEVFGAPYDGLELLRWRLLNPEKWAQNWEKLDPLSRAQWVSVEKNLTKVHSHNSHKYISGKVGVHLELLDNHTPGGWEK